ncbi:hypothetical protein [Ekhidna sp.]
MAIPVKLTDSPLPGSPKMPLLLPEQTQRETTRFSDGLEKIS